MINFIYAFIENMEKYFSCFIQIENFLRFQVQDKHNASSNSIY